MAEIMERKEHLVTSAFSRGIKLGSLLGRVGTSLLKDKAIGLIRSDLSKQLHRSESLLKNSRRIVNTLGSMKGAAMKLGQMLSLYEGILPVEVTRTLSLLQKEAPSIPFSTIRNYLQEELQENFALFESIEKKAYASASIGQVHRGRLTDGTEVAIKVQYPDIATTVQADLRNLKQIMRTLFSLFTTIDFKPVWQELKERLLEELDYQKEAENIIFFAKVYASTPDVIIPELIADLSTKSVLTMKLQEGIAPNQACSQAFSQELKNQWGTVLFDFIVRGLFEHRILHADPNFANFAFLPGGKVIVYDFGCIKQIPAHIATSYSKLMLETMLYNGQRIPELLYDFGVYKSNGSLVTKTMTDPYVEVFQQLVREEPPYNFGVEKVFQRRLVELGKAHWQESLNIEFPKDSIFINRTLGGHLGNLTKLRAAGPWRNIIYQYASLHT